MSDQEGVGEEKKRKRNRKPVTCRRSSSSCQEAGVECEWDGAIRLPPSNYTRDQEALELRSQLDRLEGLLGVLGGDDLGGAIGSSLSALRSDFEARGDLQPQGGSMSPPTASTSSHLFAPPSSPLDHILSSLPSRNELDTLVHQFILEEAARLPIIHANSFRARYRTFDRTSGRSDPFFAAFLFSIAAWGTYWRATDSRSGVTGASAAHKAYFDSAMQCLHLGGYMTRPTLDSVRTLLVLYQYQTQQEIPGSAFLLSSAIMSAQMLGLNRDPGSYSGLSFAEAEERRRIWTLLVSFDWINSIGRTYFCSPFQHDTLLPGNSQDDDISAQGVLTRPLSTPTPILQLLFNAQIATVARSITDRALGIQLVPSLTVLLELNAELSRIDETLPPCLNFEWISGAVAPFGEEVTLLDFMRVDVNLAVRHQFLRLHRSFLTRGFVDGRFAFSREKACWSARYILAIHRGLGDDYRASRWANLVFHSLNALCILAVDLFQDPNGTFADVHRADVVASLRLLEGLPQKSPSVRETIHVVNTLLQRHPPRSSRAATFAPHESGTFGGVVSPTRRSTDLSFILSDQGPPLPSTSAPPAPIASGSSTNQLRPFDANAPFSIPLPVSMSAEPYILPSSASTPSADRELLQVWNRLASLSTLYAVPDVGEWEELCLSAGRPWANGIDLLL
ncbi:hypothetical protein MNV49_006759 [Pseudohyphozyma bogoriensis]|nr:hypothetical protein MNV49_006759 [Pseudohyphozyma bogoriensis]